MRRLAFISLLVLTHACTTGQNPIFCDNSSPCDDDGYCDTGGLFGTANQCVDARGVCDPSLSDQCTESASHPVCDPTIKLCRFCLDSTECPEGICDLATGQCEVAVCNAEQSSCPPGAPSCNVDAGQCEACVPGAEGDAICADAHAPRNYCVDGGCAECRDSLDCLDGKVCSIQNYTCGPCKANAECPTGACDMANGACIEDTEILYVDVTDDAAVADGQCTADAPCVDLARPLDLITNQGDARTIVVVRSGPGTTYQGHYELTKSMSIFGSGETFTNDTPDTPVFRVTGAETDVSLESLVVTGSTGTTAGHGVQCAGTMDEHPTMRLMRMEVRGNDTHGVNSSMCTLVTVDRSLIASNERGGLSLVNSGFEVRNNFIVQNGKTDVSTIGGVLLLLTEAMEPHVFDFNTVAGNVTMNTVAQGVRCNVFVPINVTGNLLYGGSSTMLTSGDCTYFYSNIQSGPMNNGNIDVPPVFVDSENLDYHLVPDSGGLDVQGPDGFCTAETPCVDIDGEVRPMTDGKFDIGADELIE